MLTTTLFAFAVILAGTVIASALLRALPHVSGLRRALAAADARMEMRFRIAETVVSYDDGKVVALSIRARPLPQQGLRAAA
ncbi:MAG: hypothetical protein KGM49_09745 [Sphingomonadales bacterium]|nr:hypothetical protein [Sphingomonadales bacterium]